MAPYRVLLICTANYCRSPLAEQLLSARCVELFGPDNSWEVSSAGTDVGAARSMHSYSAQVLIDRRAFVDGHRSRMVDAGMIKDADLILTATREHRAFIARMLPAAIGRTFTVRQFARLAAAVEPVESRDPTELGHRLLVEAKAARALLQPVPPEDDDLADPMGGPVEAFERCAVVLSESVDAIMSPLHLL